MGRQHQGMDRPGVRQVPEGSGERGNMQKTGCKIICGAPTTLAVKGLVMMMICTPVEEGSSLVVCRRLKKTHPTKHCSRIACHRVSVNTLVTLVV